MLGTPEIWINTFRNDNSNFEAPSEYVPPQPDPHIATSSPENLVTKIES